MALVTDTNKTPVIQIVTWATLGLAILCVLGRAYTKWRAIQQRPRIEADDIIVPLALLFLAGQSAMVTVETIDGLGKPWEELPSNQQGILLILNYIATLLYIPSLCFSKLASVFLIRRITAYWGLRTLAFLVGLLIVAWAMTGELLVAFQCELPNPWDATITRCSNRSIFFLYLESMNAFTELLLVFVPFLITIRDRNIKTRKAHVLLVFSARILVAGAILTKILLYYPAFLNPQPDLSTWPNTVCTQIIQFLSLFSACILYTRPFLDALSSGFIDNNALTRRGLLTPFLPPIDQASTKEKEEADLERQSSIKSTTSKLFAGLDWPLPAHGLFSDSASVTESAHGVTLNIKTPKERRSLGKKPSIVLTGKETKRFELEQTKEGTYVPPSSSRGGNPFRINRHDAPVGPLGLPALPRSEIPIGRNNLPCVSQVYSPALIESPAFQSYMMAKKEPPILEKDGRPVLGSYGTPVVDGVRMF